MVFEGAAMNTITVWVLMLVTDTGIYRGHIDNIATREECVRLHDVTVKHARHTGSYCMEARKVKGGQQ